MNDQTPVEAVTAAFEALEHGKWRELAALIDPDSLAAIRGMNLGLLVSMQAAPEMADPPAGGGSLVAIQEPSNDFLNRFSSVKLRMFPGAPTVGELGSLSAKEFFVWWQEASHQVPLAFRAYSAIRRLFQHKEESKPFVLGAVTEGDGLAHVLYRQSGYGDPWQADLITVRRSGKEWLLQIDHFKSGLDPFQTWGTFLMGRLVLGSWFKEKVKAWFRFGRRS